MIPRSAPVERELFYSTLMSWGLIARFNPSAAQPFRNHLRATGREIPSQEAFFHPLRKIAFHRAGNDSVEDVM